MDVIGLFLFIVGLFFGSFYNVVAERLSRNESIVKPGSHCVNCMHRLTWYELIPVFSYLFLGGKCRICHIKIGKQYLFVELLTGISFFLVYLFLGISYKTIIGLILVSILIITFITDFKYYIILDEVIITGTVFILITYFFCDKSNLIYYLESGLVIFLIMFLIKKVGDFAFKKESLGFGDVKLSFIGGLVLGIRLGLFYIFLGSLLALIPALIVSRKNEEHIIPFGPFLITSMLIIFINYDFFYEFLIKLIGG